MTFLPDLPNGHVGDESWSAETKADAQAVYQRLRTHPDTAKVIEKLTQRGLDKDWIFSFMMGLPRLCAEAELTVIESQDKPEDLNQRRRRHAKIAERMHALAEELDQNRDTAEIGVLDDGVFRYAAWSIPGMRAKLRLDEKSLVPLKLQEIARLPHPTVAQWLKGCAHYVRRRLIRWEDEDILRAVPVKRQLKIFVIRRIYGELRDMIDTPQSEMLDWGPSIKDRRSPNWETATLTNIILDLPRPGTRAVTANSVAQEMKKVRHPYNQPARSMKPIPTAPIPAPRPCRSAPTIIIEKTSDHPQE